MGNIVDWWGIHGARQVDAGDLFHLCQYFDMNGSVFLHWSPQQDKGKGLGSGSKEDSERPTGPTAFYHTIPFLNMKENLRSRSQWIKGLLPAAELQLNSWNPHVGKGVPTPTAKKKHGSQAWDIGSWSQHSRLRQDFTDNLAYRVRACFKKGRQSWVWWHMSAAPALGIHAGKFIHIEWK